MPRYTPDPLPVLLEAAGRLIAAAGMGGVIRVRQSAESMWPGAMPGVNFHMPGVSTGNLNRVAELAAAFAGMVERRREQVAYLAQLQAD